MIVSWNWLCEYVSLKGTPAELTERLMMAGLNHEGTEPLGNDWAIDLEITSNRPDCLGHIGVAREAAVLLGLPLGFSDAKLPAIKKPPQPAGAPRIAEDLRNYTSVDVACPDRHAFIGRNERAQHLVMAVDREEREQCQQAIERCDH